MNDEQESNPYVSPSLPNENLAVNPKGKTHPILEATIRLIGILSFAGSLRCILTPDAMNWIAGPIVMAMYSLKGRWAGPWFIVDASAIFHIWSFSLLGGMEANHFR